MNQDAKASPTAATVQRAILHDRMDITGIRAGAPDAARPAATVTFRLFSNATCTTQVGANEVRPVSRRRRDHGDRRSSSPARARTYYWTAAYSGDAFNNPVTKGCGSETTAVTFVQ